MMRSLDFSLIVVCHYVREDERFFPITPRNLDQVIKTLQRTHHIVSLPDFGGGSRTKPQCIFTFDDGLSDHYDFVLPMLLSHGIPAHFFPSTAPLNKPIVLDTHIIHILLATLGEGWFAQVLTAKYRELSVNFDLHDFSNSPRFNRWATPLVSNIKTSLRMLDRNIRRAILVALLEEYVGDEEEISSNFYLQPNQLKEMVTHSMHIGCHGHHHLPLSTLRDTEMADELRTSLKILASIVPHVDSIAYPFGDFDHATRLIARQEGLSYGLSIEERPLSNTDDPLALPRYDIYSVCQALGLT